jgi:hypothetical protein
MYEYLKDRVQTDTKYVGDSEIKIICYDINSVPDELRKFAEVDIDINVGILKLKDEYGDGYTRNAFFIKHEGVTMLFSYGFTPSSGYFKSNNGTELILNCEESNTLNTEYLCFIGVSEHLDKISGAGF